MIVVIQPKARRDVSDMIAYLTPRSVQAAGRLPEAIEQTLTLLAAMPGVGEKVRLRGRAVPALRMTPLKRFKKYVVYYTADDDVLTIVRIVHSARDRDAIFQDES